MGLWINHPRSKTPDTMLTISVFAFFACLFKFMANGVTFELGDKVINLGTVDATLIGAMLTPTLAAYAVRKFKDSPDTKKED